jgi:hypothetical protein
MHFAATEYDVVLIFARRNAYANSTILEGN